MIIILTHLIGCAALVALSTKKDSLALSVIAFAAFTSSVILAMQ